MMRCMTTTTNARVIETDVKQINLARSVSLIDVVNPSLKEIKEIHEKFNIAITDIRSSLDPYESPRIKQTKDYLLFIYSQVNNEERGKRSCGPVGFFMGRRYLLLVHTCKLKFLDELNLDDQGTKKMFHAGTEILLFRILYALIKDAASVFENIEDELEQLEDNILKSRDTGLMHMIFPLKNRLLYLRKAMTGNRTVINSLIKDVPLIKDNALFAELNVEIMQLADTVEIYRERLTSIIEIHMGNVSNKINITMKYFTVIASVLLVPMLITGLYGMNVALPFQGYTQAFWIVIGIIATCILVMLLFFNQRRWL